MPKKTQMSEIFITEGSLVSKNTSVYRALREVLACKMSYRSDFFKFFGVGAIAGAAGAAGAPGFATAFLAPAAIGGFAGGAMTGAIGGGISGFVLGGGNALISGGDFWKSALMGALIGTASGAIVGGVSGGIYAKTHKGGFWTGKPQATPTCHRPAMTKPDAMPRQLGNFEGNATKISPNIKGKMGVQMAMAEFEEEGGTVLSQEVTISVGNTTIRPDFVGIKDDMLYIYEVTSVS